MTRRSVWNGMVGILLTVLLHTVRAMAAIARLSFLNRPTISAAMCWASAALPPFPMRSSLPPPARLSFISRAASRIFSDKVSAT